MKIPFKMDKRLSSKQNYLFVSTFLLIVVCWSQVNGELFSSPTQFSPAPRVRAPLRVPIIKGRIPYSMGSDETLNKNKLPQSPAQSIANKVKMVSSSYSGPNPAIVPPKLMSQSVSGAPNSKFLAANMPLSSPVSKPVAPVGSVYQPSNVPMSGSPGGYSSHHQQFQQHQPQQQHHNQHHQPQLPIDNIPATDDHTSYDNNNHNKQSQQQFSASPSLIQANSAPRQYPSESASTIASASSSGTALSSTSNTGKNIKMSRFPLDDLVNAIAEAAINGHIPFNKIDMSRPFKMQSLQIPILLLRAEDLFRTTGHKVNFKLITAKPLRIPIYDEMNPTALPSHQSTQLHMGSHSSSNNNNNNVHNVHNHHHNNNDNNYPNNNPSHTSHHHNSPQHHHLQQQQPKQPQHHAHQGRISNSIPPPPSHYKSRLNQHHMKHQQLKNGYQPSHNPLNNYPNQQPSTMPSVANNNNNNNINMNHHLNSGRPNLNLNYREMRTFGSNVPNNNQHFNQHNNNNNIHNHHNQHNSLNNNDYVLFQNDQNGFDNNINNNINTNKNSNFIKPNLQSFSQGVITNSPAPITTTTSATKNYGKSASLKASKLDVLKVIPAPKLNKLQKPPNHRPHQYSAVQNNNNNHNNNNHNNNNHNNNNNQQHYHNNNNNQNQNNQRNYNFNNNNNVNVNNNNNKRPVEPTTQSTYSSSFNYNNNNNNNHIVQKQPIQPNFNNNNEIKKSQNYQLSQPSGAVSSSTSSSSSSSLVDSNKSKPKRTRPIIRIKAERPPTRINSVKAPIRLKPERKIRMQPKVKYMKDKDAPLENYEDPQANTQTEPLSSKNKAEQYQSDPEPPAKRKKSVIPEKYLKDMPPYKSDEEIRALPFPKFSDDEGSSQSGSSRESDSSGHNINSAFSKSSRSRNQAKELDFDTIFRKSTPNSNEKTDQEGGHDDATHVTSGDLEDLEKSSYDKQLVKTLKNLMATTSKRHKLNFEDKEESKKVSYSTSNRNQRTKNQNQEPEVDNDTSSSRSKKQKIPERYLKNYDDHENNDADLNSDFSKQQLLQKPYQHFNNFQDSGSSLPEIDHGESNNDPQVETYTLDGFDPNYQYINRKGLTTSTNHDHNNAGEENIKTGVETLAEKIDKNGKRVKTYVLTGVYRQKVDDNGNSDSLTEGDYHHAEESSPVEQVEPSPSEPEPDTLDTPTESDETESYEDYEIESSTSPSSSSLSSSSLPSSSLSSSLPSKSAYTNVPSSSSSSSSLSS